MPRAQIDDLEIAEIQGEKLVYDLRITELSTETRRRLCCGGIAMARRNGLKLKRPCVASLVLPKAFQD
jgi:hypothetical protein